MEEQKQSTEVELPDDRSYIFIIISLGILIFATMICLVNIYVTYHNKVVDINEDWSIIVNHGKINTNLKE